MLKRQKWRSGAETATVWHEVIPNQTERSPLFREDDCYECDTWRMQGVDPNGVRNGRPCRVENVTIQPPPIFCPFGNNSYIGHRECGYTGTPSYPNNGWTKQAGGAYTGQNVKINYKPLYNCNYAIYQEEKFNNSSTK